MKPIEELTTREIKNQLDELEVAYKGNLPKTELYELLKSKLNEVTPTSETQNKNNAMSLEEMEKYYKQKMEEEAEILRAEYEAKLHKNDDSLRKKIEISSIDKKEAMKLVRVIVNCNDPLIAREGTELLRVSNDIVDTGVRAVPFGRTEPFHLPQILVNMMKEKKTTIFVKQVNKKLGKQVDVPKHINKYTIQEFPPLTKEEFERIKHAQEKRQALVEEGE